MFNRKLKKRVAELEGEVQELLELCRMQTENRGKVIENLEILNQRVQVLEATK